MLRLFVAQEMIIFQQHGGICVSFQNRLNVAICAFIGFFCALSAISFHSFGIKTC
jgi:hypothetical protein